MFTKTCSSFLVILYSMLCKGRRSAKVFLTIGFLWVSALNIWSSADAYTNRDAYNEIDVYPFYGLSRDGQQWIATKDLTRLQALTAQHNLTIRNLLGFLDDANPAYNSRIGIFLFTRYCGPGSRLWNKIFNQDKKTYAEIDGCCQMHDECPNYVENFNDYYNYPGLEYRPQFFSRLQCKCDSDFYKCLQSLNAPYAHSVGFGYGIFQRFCFEFEHPILDCVKQYSAFGFKRCIVYRLDYNQPKRWQWFDVLPSFLNITDFPQFV